MTDTRSFTDCLRDFFSSRWRLLWTVVAVLIMFSFMAGCAQIQLVTPDTQMAVVVVEWSSQEQIAKACGAGQKSGGPVMGCYVEGKIYAPRPSSWNDDQAMMVLGHEVMHALGATH